uniref:Zinc-binding loop region of homing endonuclease domain-containing protein n=1 Tax=Branchiostoma floridae TaxID=7739 RepID=C3Y1X4_BRAFL|eukprot:XP_002609854.1 hypothetical protein BRAFLDRAFT_90782 [Branchiostoma floridae]
MAFYMSRPSEPYSTHLKQILMENSKDVGNCREWKGHINKDGYGGYTTRNPTNGTRYTLAVHRLAYFLYTEWRPALQKNIHVSHRCNNKLCLRVDHLSYEPACINAQRTSCQDQGACFTHTPFRDCIL